MIVAVNEGTKSPQDSAGAALCEVEIDFLWLKSIVSNNLDVWNTPLHDVHLIEFGEERADHFQFGQSVAVLTLGIIQTSRSLVQIA